MLDEKSPVALYYQLRQIVKEKIENNEWPVNSKIPTEADLTKQYGVSRATVRQALNELVNEKYLYRKQGKGTFVLLPKIEQSLSSYYSFSDELRRKGMDTYCNLLEFKTMSADGVIRRIMNLDDSDPYVHMICRKRYADGDTFSIDCSYIPHKYYSNFSLDMLKQKGLYVAMFEASGIKLDTATQSFEAVLLSKEHANLLEVARPFAGLKQERITSSNDIVMEYCVSIIRGDRYKVGVILK